MRSEKTNNGNGLRRGDAENAEKGLGEKRQQPVMATFSRRTCPPRVAAETATTAASRGDAENAEKDWVRNGQRRRREPATVGQPRSGRL